MSEQTAFESKGETGVSAGNIVWLDPTEILIPEESNVRPFTSMRGDTESEIEALEELGKSMADPLIGQLEPIIVTPSVNLGGPRYTLIAGRRRTRAAKLYNTGADKPIQLMAVVKSVRQDKTRNQVLFKSALHENVQRKNLNAMDFAMNIRDVREKAGPAGKGSKGTEKVARFFGVSQATIIQHEKLLTLDTETQEQVARGELSNEAAFELVKALDKVEPGKRAEVKQQVVETARQEQEKEQERPESDGEGKKKRKPRATKALKAKHVKTAIRQVTGGNTKRSRSELLEFFSAQLGPTNGHPNGSIHQFCEGIAGWAEGKVSDKALTKLWDAMVEKSDRGTPEAAKKAVGGAVQVTQGKSGIAGKPAPKKAGKKTSKKK